MPVNALMVDWAVLANGNVRVTWEDGHSNLFADMAEVRAYISGLDSNPVIAEQLLIAWFIARQPDGSNTNIVEGKRLTFDLSNANPIRVQ